MEFFNKKEDVIDLELTPYGEYLLLKGKFKPDQYAFFDDEILYDSKCTDVDSEEAQNDIKDRIKEVPRLKTQSVFQNRDLPWPETSAAIMHEQATTGDPLLGGLAHPPPYMKSYILPLPLGNCSLDSDYAPAWDIKLLYNNLDLIKTDCDPTTDDTFTGEIPFLTASMHPYLQIPQLDVTIKYRTSAKSLNKELETSEHNINKSTDLRLKEFDELHESPPTYSDGYYDFQEDFVVLEIDEHNVPYSRENFDIEIFEVDTDFLTDVLLGDNSRQAVGAHLKSLSFTKSPSSVNEKGLLRSEEENIKSIEEDLRIKLIPLDSSYVEHFFNVYVDHEIDKDLMCKLKPVTKQKGHLVSDPLDCLLEPEVNITSEDIYKEAEETTPECD